MSLNCKKCDGACHLARGKAANGSTQVFWWCARCNYYGTGKDHFIGLEYVRRVLRVNPDDLPLVERFSDVPKHVCEYYGCISTDTEYHHWAPRHLFDDADNWPGSWLCRVHHPAWHAIVTPQMCAPHKNGKPKHHPKATEARYERA